MVKKVDRPPKVPGFEEWKSKVLTRPGPWWPYNKFLRSEKDWTIEEYLQWCEEEYPLSKRNKDIIDKLHANPEFRARVREWREEFRAKPSELKAMSREEWIEWYFEGRPIFAETWGDVRATCLRLKVTPRWLDFLLSYTFFDDGRAGYEEISRIFDHCLGDLRTGLVELSFYVSPYLTQDDLRNELWPYIERMKLRMYDQRRPRLRPSPTDDFQYLLYYLAQMEGKTVAQICQIFDDVLEEKPLDESIKRAFPEESEERLRKLIMDEVLEGLGEARIRSLIFHLEERFRLRSVPARHPLGSMEDERDAIEIYEVRRQRYHY